MKTNREQNFGVLRVRLCRGGSSRAARRRRNHDNQPVIVRSMHSEVPFLTWNLCTPVSREAEEVI